MNYPALLQAYHQGELSPEELGARLDQAVTKAPHTAAEALAALEQARREATLPEPLSEALARRIRALTEATRIAADDDGTRLTAPAPDTTRMAAAPAEEATRLVSSSPAAEDGATRVVAAPGRTGAGSPLGPGTRLKGRFVLEEVVGRGGMGIVFRARDLRKEEAQDRNPFVAIKILNDSFKQHPQSLIALQREARKAQNLAHPNIVNVFDFDRDGDTVFMTMEYLQGQSLDRVLKERYPRPLERERALPIIDGIANALSHAHQHGVIHSDLKPGNVFVTDSGQVKVFDFGIARAITHGGEQDGEHTLFDAGSLGGLTPAYASCEMLEGQEPDVRDDIYALACIACELLTGRHPYNKLPADQACQRRLKPPPVPGLSRRQQRVLRQGLAFHREQRLGSAAELAAGLREGKHRRGGALTLALLVLIVAAVVAYGPGRDFLEQRRIDALLASLDEAPDLGAVRTLVAEIQSLPPVRRSVLLNQVKDPLIEQYRRQAEARINTAQGHYDFPAAVQLLAEARRLYPDSATLAQITSRVEERKNRLLNELTTAFNSALEQGRLLDDPAGEDVFDVLQTVRQIDPDHPLLTDARLPLAYQEAAERARRQNRLAQAQALLAAGLSLFPAHPQLINLQDLVAQAREVGGKTDTTAAALGPEEHEQRLQTLLARPFAGRGWSQEAIGHLKALEQAYGRDDQRVRAGRAALSQAHMQRAKDMLAASRFSEARATAERIARFQGDVAAAQSLLAEIKGEQAAFEQQAREKARLARLEGLKQTLLTQAKANDVTGAKRTLDKLHRQLPLSDPFLTETAPQALGQAYLRLGQDLLAQSAPDSALKLLESARTYIPDAPALQETLAAAQSAVHEQWLKSHVAGAAALDAGEIERRLQALPPRHRNALREELARIAAQRVETAATHDLTAAHALLAQARQSFPGEAVLKNLSLPEAAAPDPCQARFAGHGRLARATCRDNLGDGRRGPVMVVIPAGGGFSRPFAIGKYEVSVADFNAYCQASGRCPGLRDRAKDLPVTGITLAQARDYARWLSEATGYRYRLPRGEEWRYAAEAGGKQPEKDFNCRVSLGSRLLKGNALLSVRSGKHNGWGLMNYVGNAQEWVLAGQAVEVRGGSYRDPLAQCAVSLRRNHSGKADDVTGFRLVRELKPAS
ncbi:MAG TPA: hypothetical protein ENJ19_05235 [Gammaproteobacteria bacterium]|nr:hypothetical protein [Gammaproteobacteria bacterium]